METRPSVLSDVSAYVVSALFALGVAVFASVPIYREWGRIAAGPYAAGAIAAVVLAIRRAPLRVRIWVALLVLAGAALLPLGLEVAWRARTSPGLHAQADSPAAGKMDLLSVVEHELGHVLGLPDLDPVSNAGDVMAGTLATGVRRVG